MLLEYVPFTTCTSRFMKEHVPVGILKQHVPVGIFHSECIKEHAFLEPLMFPA